MDEEEREVNRKTWWIMGIIILLLIIGAGGYYIWHQQQQMQTMEDAFALDKELIQSGIEEVSLRYESVKINFSDDSLRFLVETEQAKVARLQEELRTVKSTNTKRINELKREIETLRKVMRNYIVQIDSLNAENEKLKAENLQVNQKLQQSTSRAARLTKDNEQLAGKVQIAERLDAVNIQLKPTTSRGKDSKGLSKATQLVLTFIISKNINAPVGDQTLYVRLMKPDGDVLRKPDTGSFRFENKDIAYSMKRDIVFDGEEQSVLLYWDIEEFLSPGTYKVYIFAGGNQIGNKSFALEK